MPGVMQAKMNYLPVLMRPLANGAVIHIVPRLAGPKVAVCFQVVLGAALIAVAWWNPVAGWGPRLVSGMYAQGPV